MVRISYFSASYKYYVAHVSNISLILVKTWKIAPLEQKTIFVSLLVTIYVE